MNEVMQIRADSWAAMIKQRNDSGLTIREWCAANSWKRWCSVLSGITSFQAIYIYCGKCDLRKGIDGLATLVKNSSVWTHFKRTSCFFSAAAAQTALKAWYGKVMGSVCSIKGLKLGASGGREARKKPPGSRRKSSIFSWLGWQYWNVLPSGTVIVQKFADLLCRTDCFCYTIP